MMMTRPNRDPSHRIAADARRLLRFLSARRSRLSPLTILTHDYPDPDAIASALALGFIAQAEFGIRCRLVYGGVIGRTENREMVKRLKIPIKPLRPGELSKAANV